MAVPSKGPLQTGEMGWQQHHEAEWKERQSPTLREEKPHACQVLPGWRAALRKRARGTGEFVESPSFHIVKAQLDMARATCSRWTPPILSLPVLGLCDSVLPLSSSASTRWRVKMLSALTGELFESLQCSTYFLLSFLLTSNATWKKANLEKRAVKKKKKSVFRQKS